MAIIKLTRIRTIKLKGANRTYADFVYINPNKISFFGNGYICFGIKKIRIKETPEEILELIKEAELPEFTFCNNNVDFSKQKYNSRVQEIIDQAHATEILMQEKDPTYGR